MISFASTIRPRQDVSIAAGSRMKARELWENSTPHGLFVPKTSRMLGSRLGSKRERAIPGNGGAGRKRNGDENEAGINEVGMRTKQVIRDAG